MLSSCPRNRAGWRSPGQRPCRSWGTLTGRLLSRKCGPGHSGLSSRPGQMWWRDGPDSMLEPLVIWTYFIQLHEPVPLKNITIHTYTHTHTGISYWVDFSGEHCLIQMLFWMHHVFQTFFIFLDNSLIQGFNRCDDGSGGGSKVRLSCKHTHGFYELRSCVPYLLQVVRRTWSDGKSTWLRVKGRCGGLGPVTDHCCSISRR